MERILLVEDDAALARGIALALDAHERTVTAAQTAAEARRAVAAERFDLVLLDINLPDASGLELLCDWRANGDQTPVILLTANDMEMDEVVGLEAGANDYITKPFSLAVLRARIRRILQAQTPSAMVTSGGITIDRKAAQVFRGEKKIDLSKIEYQLLCYLVENREQVLTKEQILARVWDAQGKFVDENTLSVTIRRLRAKIERDPKHPELIRTVHGIGYVWKSEEEKV